jgi:PBP1b-binding outer membrane lipoprotein LpoB
MKILLQLFLLFFLAGCDVTTQPVSEDSVKKSAYNTLKKIAETDSGRKRNDSILQAHAKKDSMKQFSPHFRNDSVNRDSIFKKYHIRKPF